MTLAYIAIGSNLASPLEQVNAAVQALGEIPQSRIVAVSSFYRTPPLGPQDQPDYLNAAVVLETIKRAESGDAVVLRLYESLGKPAQTSLSTSFGYDKAVFCDLLERPSQEADLEHITLTPYQIVSIRLEGAKRK